MFLHQDIPDLQCDEIAFIRAYKEAEDSPKVKSVDPTDVPEPVALLAARARVQTAALEVTQQEKKHVSPPMPKTSPFDSPVPMGVLATLAATTLLKKPEPEIETLQDPWFETQSSYEPVAPLVETPKKKTWFAAFTDRLNNAVEKFGNFLDKAVPVISAGALAITLGTLGSQLNNFNKITTTATAPIQTSVVYNSTQTTSPNNKAEVKKIDSVAQKNQALLEKRVEIVQKAGGVNARYLHSEYSHRHFISQLEKWGGYRTVLNHPAVKEARTTAQMINLVDQYFGEKVADLVEANAAAMHLPAPLSL